MKIFLIFFLITLPRLAFAECYRPESNWSSDKIREIQFDSNHGVTFIGQKTTQRSGWTRSEDTPFIIPLKLNDSYNPHFDRLYSLILKYGTTHVLMVCTGDDENTVELPKKNNVGGTYKVVESLTAVVSLRTEVQKVAICDVLGNDCVGIDRTRTLPTKRFD